MVSLETPASEVYELGLATHRRGVHPDLLTTNPELGLMIAGYWAMVRFLEKRGAMMVGDMIEPDIVVGHLEKEQREAEEVVGDYPKLRLEIGDVNFLGLVNGGLLWEYLQTAEKARVREIMVWSSETAKRNGIDPDKSVVWAAEKNEPNYPADKFILYPGEMVREVVARLPTIYRELRLLRNQGQIGTDNMRQSGYSHDRARAGDTHRWGRYDS